jgi:hypothetical protein
MRQNVGKEKHKSTCFGIFYKNRHVQVMNFIPVKVSTLYKGNVCSIRDEVREIRRLNNRRS